MLKGLKKSKAGAAEEDVASRVRSAVDESSIKASQIAEEQLQPSAVEVFQREQERQTKEALEVCLQLFLSGRVEQLEQELLRVRQKLVPAGPSAPSRGKFEYNMSFEGEGERERVKREIKKRNRPIMASNRVQEYCPFCPDNEEAVLVSASNYAYLALPRTRTFEGLFHLVLAPVDHEQTAIGLNADTLTELSNYRKCLIQAFDKYDLQPVFFEQFSRDNTHIYTECLAMPRARALDLPFFFKQALEDVEGSWGTHASIIRISREKGGLQAQIPKQMKYFFVDFVNGDGFAHVIENERAWKREFCYEVMATALNIEMHKVKTTQTYTDEELDRMKEAFEKIWKPFDWTQLI